MIGKIKGSPERELAIAFKLFDEAASHPELELLEQVLIHVYRSIEISFTLELERCGELPAIRPLPFITMIEILKRKGIIKDRLLIEELEQLQNLRNIVVHLKTPQGFSITNDEVYKYLQIAMHFVTMGSPSDYLSYGERAVSTLTNFHAYLTSLRSKGTCYELPQMVKRIQIENIGLFDQLQLDFKKGVNVLMGSNSSGKTTIINTLAYVYGLLGSGKSYRYFRSEKNGGKVLVEPFAGVMGIEYKMQKDQTVISTSKKCLLLDEPLTFDMKNMAKFVNLVKKEYAQAIITSTDKEFFMTHNIGNILRLTSAS